MKLNAKPIEEETAFIAPAVLEEIEEVAEEIEEDIEVIEEEIDETPPEEDKLLEKEAIILEEDLLEDDSKPIPKVLSIQPFRAPGVKKAS